MAEWVHKGIRPRASRALDRELAMGDHFLSRSIFAHAPASHSARPIDLVEDVAVGDLIHYYYRTPEGQISCMGSFRVLDAGRYPEVFEPCTGHGAVARVRDTSENRAMLKRLRRGYSPDPELDAFTGWVVERLPLGSTTPGFDQARMFPSRTTSFWRYPDPELPRRNGDPTPG